MNWGKGLALSLIAFAAMMAAFGIASARRSEALVTEEYYEEELRFQDRIDAQDRAHALSAEQALPLRQRAIRESLEALSEDLGAVQRYWREVDAADRVAPAIAMAAARAFAAAGDCREAQRVVEDALAEHWDSALVVAYADCHGGDVLGRIAIAEKWLHQHPTDEALLLTLGRLCRQQQLWGKARSFMEASLAVLPTRTAHVELAQLLDELQESALAARHYRAAATL